MRFTVASKIWLGCIIILGLGTVPMLVVYRGLLRVRQEMRHLADVQEPVKSATHELEINVKGIAIGTLGYLSTPNPMFRELVANNEADFERFHAEYFRLATTEQEKELGERIGRLYRQFKDQSRELKTRRDQQGRAFAEIVAKLEQMDKIIDQQLGATLEPRRPSDFVKLERVQALEADLAEVGMWVSNYRRSHRHQHKALIYRNIEECRATFGRLKRFEWATQDQRQTVRRLENLFENTTDKVQEVLAHEDGILTGTTLFLGLRQGIDDLLDEQMQPLAVDLLRGPRKEAEAATASVVIQMGWLIPLFVLSAALASLLLIRAVTRPLKSLARGTEVVSQGDLAYRAPLVSTDEFAMLAQAFNRMVARLQQTLVSKEMLEESEYKLRQTVHTLQQEISERTRAEEERLQVLHTMSDLSEFNKRLGNQRKAMLHILVDYEHDRRRLARQADRLDDSRRALMHILQDSHRDNLRLEGSRKAMIHIMGDLRETTAAVERREQELREKQEQLVQAGKLATLGELTTGVAHELNNPLNNIGLFVGNAVDLIELGATDKGHIIREMGQAMQQVRKATEIISHLRTFGRAAPFSRDPVSLRQVIEQAFSLMQEQLRLRDIQVTVDLGSEEPVVLGNPVQLEQVFINLLTNARDAVAGSSRKAIRISGSVSSEAVEVAVADTGDGIPPGLETRIFDPFFTTKEVGKGTGLGLSITYGIIKELGGTISVVSPPGEGATFLIHLPLAPTDTKETSPQ
jgi:signal transduction histidine kinase